MRSPASRTSRTGTSSPRATATPRFSPPSRPCSTSGRSRSKSSSICSTRSRWSRSCAPAAGSSAPPRSGWARSPRCRSACRSSVGTTAGAPTASTSVPTYARPSSSSAASWACGGSTNAKRTATARCCAYAGRFGVAALVAMVVLWHFAQRTDGVLVQRRPRRLRAPHVARRARRRPTRRRRAQSPCIPAPHGARDHLLRRVSHPLARVRVRRPRPHRPRPMAALHPAHRDHHRPRDPVVQLHRAARTPQPHLAAHPAHHHARRVRARHHHRIRHLATRTHPRHRPQRIPQAIREAAARDPHARPRPRGRDVRRLDRAHAEPGPRQLEPRAPQRAPRCDRVGPTSVAGSCRSPAASTARSSRTTPTARTGPRSGRRRPRRVRQMASTRR